MKYSGAQVVRLATSGLLAIAALNLIAGSLPAAAQSPLYKPCADYKLSQPLTLATPGATQAATTAASQSSTAAPASGSDDIVFLSIVGADSEACYVASERFLENNTMDLPSGFNGAVGVTKTIQGDVALDRTNTANSQIGDITINISEFKSDEDHRDSYIRNHFLESNKYPFATLTNVVAVGIPGGAYQDGTTLHFQITGTLTVHNTRRDTVFDASGSYSNGTLVVTAFTQLKMSEFGITVPDLGGLLKVDDAMALVINIVARQQQASATAAR